MAEQITRPGLAYGVVKYPECSDQLTPLNRWKNFKTAIEGIMRTGDKILQRVGVDVTAAPLRAGVVQMRFDCGPYGPYIADKIDALEKDGANYLIRISLPDVPTAIVANVLGDVMKLLKAGDPSLHLMDIFYVEDNRPHISTTIRVTTAPL